MVTLSELGKITFDTANFHNNLQHPIAYTFMFIQWEANRVISHELIRNLSLTFGTIAIGKYQEENAFQKYDQFTINTSRFLVTYYY